MARVTHIRAVSLFFLNLSLPQKQKLSTRQNSKASTVHSPPSSDTLFGWNETSLLCRHLRNDPWDPNGLYRVKMVSRKGCLNSGETRPSGECPTVRTSYKWIMFSYNNANEATLRRRSSSSFTSIPLAMASSSLPAFALFLIILASTSFTVSAEVDNVITQWHFTAQKVVRALGVPSQVASRTYTLVHLSQYKAIQLAHKSSGSHPEAAAAYAAHYVLSEIYPTQQSTIFDGVIDKQITPLELSVADDEASRKAGLKFAKSLLKKRSYDGSQSWAKFHPSPPGGPTGKYQFTPNQTYALYPQFAKTRPFVVQSLTPYDKNGGPNKIPSANYNADYEELATIGNANSSLQTAAFKATAWFWEGGANTSTINGQLFNATLAIIAHDTSVDDTAKLFTLISIAQYDSSIAGWSQKYHYLFWRPVTALRQGESSHQPITFTPYLRTPPHPEYPSTHSTAAGSWAQVVARYLKISLSHEVPSGAYTVATEGYLLPPRTYTTLEAVATEIGVSRIYGGIHFRKSVNDGLTVGYEVADYVWDHFEEEFGNL